MFSTILELFLWAIWIWTLIWIFIDIFRSRDLSGASKALWFLFVLFIPLFGVLAYLVARGGSMHERSVREVRRQDEEFQAYVRQAAGPHNNTADRLAMLADLRDRGVITTAEGEQEKTRVLA